MNFSGSGVDTTEVRKPAKSIKPGIHKLAIASVEYTVSTDKGTPGIRFILMTAPVEGLKDEKGNTIGQKCVETWWMSPKAWDNNGKPTGANWCTKARLSILADKLEVREQFDAAKGKDAEEFVKNLIPLFLGKKARFAVGGEEQSFENDEGKTIKFVKPKLLTFKFVEGLDVPENESELEYDETDPYHFKPMAEADKEESPFEDSSADANPEW
jgi:hypothetical protein